MEILNTNNNQNFEWLLSNAINQCEGIYSAYFSEHAYSPIYPFTTENISGYINKFSLENKKLLTTGSSCDQVLNAILYGCKDITVVDSNPYTPFYFYLKFACFYNLQMFSYLKFLRYKDYPENYKDNKEVFNKETYNEIKLFLRSMDYSSYLFWDELFQLFDSITIRENLFNSDEFRTKVIIQSNPYLANENTYNALKEKIKNVKIKFITENILHYNSDEKYDSIWLSNIGQFMSYEEIIKMVEIMSSHLNKHGKLLISYLYSTTIDSVYADTMYPIYNLDYVFEILKNYNLDLSSFIGVDGIKFSDKKINDSVLIHTKR